jgi:hypothetical protein
MLVSSDFKDMAATTAEHVLTIRGREVPVRVSINRRAKRLILKVDNLKGEILLTCPSKRTVREGLQFAASRQHWLAQQLAEGPQLTAFADGSELPLRGLVYTIRHFPEKRHRVIEQAELQELWVGGAPEHLKRRVEDWLKREARNTFMQLADAFTSKLGVSRRRLTVRDTKSRWGSCSSDGAIMLSWRLIMAPEYVYRYVVAHEVAHLRHMDHSPAFWRTVEELVDERHQAKDWLAQHGAELYGVGLAASSVPDAFAA